MKPINVTLSAFAISFSLLSSVAVAESQALSASELQAAVLAGGCAGCHGTEGRLTGLPSRTAETLETQLLNFKNDRLPSTVMGRITRGFTDEEISEIAQYFASLDN